MGLAGAVAACMAVAESSPQAGNVPVANNNIIDEVAWVVGDEPIYRSEIEEMYQQAQYEGTIFDNSPYCAIPEQIAVEKLYLHQAKIDTIEAPESAVRNAVDQRINFFIANLGSKERVEQQFRKPMSAIREQLNELFRTQYTIQQVQQNLTKDVKSTPAEVRKYFNSLPEDSIPSVPLQVETQIITLAPPVPQSEIDSIKARLREFTEKINSGESQFSTLAYFYSEDGSAKQGGELGFHGRADFVPEFSAVAFNLNDPKKVSKIVETEFGYHIIQLIEKRGEQANVRHILLRPKPSREMMDSAMYKLDSLQREIKRGLFTFEEAAGYVSSDKDTKNNKGIMMNPQTGSSRFEMSQLPAEVARQVENMQPGDVSLPFVMMNQSTNKEVVAIVKLTNRIPAHKANLSDDFSMLKDLYEVTAKNKILKDWVEKKIKQTYVHIEDGWEGCDFEYQGWIK
ncbi:MAG: peptidylprolyl isomerase [Prevotella sp.]|nr:peptidylprolyl isomerase [Prevotella sp.]MCM1074428.1 peptidylprolyl isomerase [Ruminococcus sp.]